MDEALTDVSRLLRILMVRQVMTWNKDGDSSTILKRQANLVELVPLPVPENRQMNSIMRCYRAHERKLE